MEAESGAGAAAAVPPEQELTEALLSLSWPLPRTVEDADAALTRLEEVKAVLTRLEQQSVGSEAWWAAQVDGLATQSGFVLEWWLPVLRDPDLDWTLNHQAHLTADLATLASAGARLLDQIEPRAAEEAAAAMHARRVAQEKRWGPAAVPPFPPTGPKPRPPEQVFGEAAEQEPGPRDELGALEFPPIPPPPAPPTSEQGARQPAYDAPPAPPVTPLPLVPPAPDTQQDRDGEQGAEELAYDAPPATLVTPLPLVPPALASQQSQAAAEQGGPGVAQDVEYDAPLTPLPLVPPAAAFAGQGAEELAYDVPPVAAPPTTTEPPASMPPGTAAAPPSTAEPAAIPVQGRGPSQGRAARDKSVEPAGTSARHRRPAYDFDDPGHAAPPAVLPAHQPPVGFPPAAGPAPRSPLVPGPGFGGPPQGRTLAPGNHPGYPPPPAHGYGRSGTGPGRSGGPIGPAGPAAPGPFGFVGEEEDDERESLVPAGALRRHQRRLLMQTGAILGAIGVLCWLAVYELTGSHSHSSAAADATHTAGKTSSAANGGTAAGGLTNQNPSQTPAGTPSKTAATTASPSTPGAAPSTVRSSVPDATTVSSVRVTLLGGSSTVPQIVALITVDTAGTGQVTVTGSYYGASGSRQVAAESEQWALSGKTSYQYSVPIANGAYCGTEFHFTVSAGGHSASSETSPGC